MLNRAMNNILVLIFFFNFNVLIGIELGQLQFINFLKKQDNTLTSSINKAIHKLNSTKSFNN